MSDHERIQQLEKEVADLRAKLETICKILGLDSSAVPEDFRDRLTIPAPPPSGV